MIKVTILAIVLGVSFLASKCEINNTGELPTVVQTK